MPTLAIQLDSPTPITDQIVAGLRREIAAGRLKPSDELPPVRQLAADLGVNLNTVARSYRTLETAGLLTTVRGRGTRITSATENRGSQAAATEQVRQRMTDAVADAKLAGLSQDKTQLVFEEILAAFFPEVL